jgi:hypothetical protein
MYWSNNSKFNGLGINQNVKSAQKYFLPDMQQIHNLYLWDIRYAKCMIRFQKLKFFHKKNNKIN